MTGLLMCHPDGSMPPQYSEKLEHAYDAMAALCAQFPQLELTQDGESSGTQCPDSRRVTEDPNHDVVESSSGQGIARMLHVFVSEVERRAHLKQ